MRVSVPRSGSAVLLAASLICAAGCVQTGAPYWPTEPYQVERQLPIEDAGPRIEEGRPIAWLDGLNHYVFSLPTKLVLWNWQALDHRLPEESSTLLSHYSDLNGLYTVKVRHNQYDPIGEWHRLRHNRNIGAGYRYTLGLLSWTLYTIFPGRLFAGFPIIGIGDHFNPFTNTIHVYSSDPAILLHEAGHAKDYLGHRHRGTGFALPRLLPGIDLIQEETASSDAIHYLQCVDEHEREVDAYRSLYPAYSTYVASYLPGGVLVTAPVVVTGHVMGRIRAGAREDEIEEQAYLAERAGKDGAGVDSRTPWCEPLWGAPLDSP
jgi:hypothetical protein